MESSAMKVFRRLGRDDIAWSLRRLHVPVDSQALVLEVGSGGNPFPRANVLLDAYEVTRERHYAPLVQDRPIVLGLIEDMPFRDDAFDFVIACHVVEHSSDIGACLRELQRVARAGYIECPDAFFERINPYKDHQYEVTVRDGALVTRRKRSWIRDAELVELYEHQVQPSPKWKEQFRQNPFAFHARYFWSRDTGGIRHIDLTPAEEQSLPFERGPTSDSTAAAGSTLRSKITAVVRDVFSRRSRQTDIDIAGLLRCMSCRQPSLTRAGSSLVCGNCGRTHGADPIPRMFSETA
jgi:hypothetical protein